MGEAVSTGLVDDLLRLYFTIGIVLGLLVFFYLLYAAWRFRARDGQDPPDAPRAGEVPADRGHPPVVFGTIIIVGLILFGLSLGTLRTHEFLEHPPEDVFMTVDVTAFQFGWVFQYPHGFQTFGELRVPVNEPILLYLNSTDVMHKFHVADYNIGIDAVPGRTNRVWFAASEPGVAEIRCAELCGVGHALMVGSIAAVPDAEFDAWVNAQAGGQATEGFVQSYELTLTDGGALPDAVQAIAGGEIHLRVTNNASVPRGLAVGAPFNVTTPQIPVGAMNWVNLSAPDAAESSYWVVNETGARVGDLGDLEVLASQRVAASLDEFEIALSRDTVRQDQPILFIATNNGEVPHDLTIGGWTQEAEGRRIEVRTPIIEPGQVGYLAYFPRAAGTLDIWCNVPGHSEAGMRTTLEVQP